ncbi:MAG: GNAT family N-acetyltransferase [Polyangiaceae bacterium]|nr:GNAT family N-acetyltransferase [Polyangiaceae bacterium]
MTAAGSYTVRRPERADLERLKAFAQDIWPGSPADKLTRRWWWNDPRAPQCWIAVHNDSGDIAAMCGERRSVLVLEAMEVPVASICDWDVSPRHKGKGLGRMLVERSRADHPVMYTTSISEAAATAFTRLGWAGHRPLSVMVGCPPLVSAVARARARRDSIATRNYRISSGSDDGIRHLDAIWDSSRQDRPIMTTRDARALKAHLRLVPHRSYGLTVAFSGDTPVGYALYRTLPKGSFRRFGHTPVGLLADFWVPEQNGTVLTRLVQDVSWALARSGVPVMLALTTQSWARSALRPLGFASEDTPWLGAKLRSFASRAMHVSDYALPDFEDGWHVTFVDNDMDLIFGSLAELPT